MRHINPSCKFIGLIVITFVLAWWHNPILNLIVFGLCMVFILAAGTRPKTLILMLLPILLFSVGMFMTGFRFSSGSDMPVNEKTMVFTSSAFWNGMTLASRVFAYAGVGYLFALTTDRVLLVRSFQKQLHLPQVFAYGLLAAWGIVPQMMREYKRTRAAFRARGIKTFGASPTVLRPLLVKSIKWSEELSVAMESKGFSGSAKRTEFEPVKVHAYDWVFLAVCCIIFPVFLDFIELL